MERSSPLSSSLLPGLLDAKATEGKLSPEMRSRMAMMLGAQAPREEAEPRFPQSFLQNLQPAPQMPTPLTHLAAQPSPSAGASLPTFVPTLLAIAGRILQELEMNLTKLLQLNPGRREAIAQHLERLSGQSSNARAGTLQDSATALKRWIEGPRGPAQNAAIRTFCEEVALVSLGQAVLLKSWHDRGLRRWTEADLGSLNWALGSALKPHIPVDREGWQITRPNMYSWYNPSATIQRELWNFLDGLRLTDAVPTLLGELIRYARQASPDWPELRSYDSRFYTSLWKNMESFGFNPLPDQGPLRRKRTAFSPTLRDGTLMRLGPNSLTWIGLEAYPFQIMMAELAQLWSGPAAPPLWAVGTGLEVHSRDQLALALGSPKPSLFSRIAEMEACDLAFVVEERCVRTQARTLEAQQFREIVEQFEYFKKLRSAGTSLGDLQACVALSKLRPGGLLWWVREEPLTSVDGQSMLGFALDRAKLLCEWDFSELTHALPAAQPLFPKYLYLFCREPQVEKRLTHRPIRVVLQGQVRSHIEVPLLFEDALQGLSRTHQSRGHWQVHVQTSPTPQKEWAEKWPESTAFDRLRALEELRLASAPLGSVVTIRSALQPEPQLDPVSGAPIPRWKPEKMGLWIRTEMQPGATGAEASRKLLVERIAPATDDRVDPKNPGYYLLISDETWIAPIQAYLKSEIAQSWLEHHAERRAGRWNLTEQELKWIPVPRLILKAMGPAQLPSQEGLPALTGLPREWELLVSQVASEPRVVLEALSKLPPPKRSASGLPLSAAEAEADLGRLIRAAIFVQAARAAESLERTHGRLLGLVHQDGRISWRELLDVLPKTELCAVSVHPKIKLLGTMPPHLPIDRIERVKAPLPGILLSTESGFHLQLGSDSSMILDLVWEQLEKLVHPTWSELLQYLRLPRRIELAESTASEVLRSHGELAEKLQELQSVLSACLVL